MMTRMTPSAAWKVPLVPMLSTQPSNMCNNSSLRDTPKKQRVRLQHSTSEEVRPHLTAFKINTLQISENEFYYGQDIYHFHLDHKIGAPQPKNEGHRQTMRLIFSIVPTAQRLRPDGGAVVATAEPAHDSTVYLRWQPPRGFHHNDELHAYLRLRFPERGLCIGRDRPLYEVGDDELYRARPGEVCTHFSHPGRPVHAETNPCPEGRGLYVLDWTDVRNVGDDGRVLPASRMPIDEIIGRMRVLADASTAAFRERLAEAAATARGLLGEAAGHFDAAGRPALEAVLQQLADAERRAAQGEARDTGHSSEGAERP